MSEIHSTTGSDVAERPAGRGWIPGRRQALTGLAVAAVSGGAALNWGWLVAAGMAPLILAVLPCAAMCALGLCAMRGERRVCRGPGTIPAADIGTHLSHDNEPDTHAREFSDNGNP